MTLDPVKPIGYVEKAHPLTEKFRCVVGHQKEYLFFGKQQEQWLEGTRDQFETRLASLQRKFSGLEHCVGHDVVSNMGMVMYAKTAQADAKVMREVLDKIDSGHVGTHFTA